MGGQERQILNVANLLHALAWLSDLAEHNSSKCLSNELQAFPRHRIWKALQVDIVNIDVSLVVVCFVAKPTTCSTCAAKVKFVSNLMKAANGACLLDERWMEIAHNGS
jgi:hypothetical protein